ncbi:hypothetical protein F8G81_07510 [Arthrobacter sp. CDRTa11]|uniref:hypothetical protein n=1 Tax=Arthrobacter sp. CDRTa11 TaxID=2651199 RepID=UPI002265A0A2|nr:hypothetical protein [Arthrobacter sp. CDRTa11]UZX02480.1 hypothetical protein F8G81_07510 [Arthrobacter sp. CDRTa11]
MISDSIPWREELWRVADRLEKKSKQQRWTERSSFLVERDMMTSAYAIRRLNEAHKISDVLAKTRVPVIRYARIGGVPDIWNRQEFWEHYDLENGQGDQITIPHLCNQLIHSFVWIISGNKDTELFDGAFVASENERHKHLYFLPVESLIDLCRKVAAEDIGSVQYQRGTDGIMRIVSVKVMEDDWQEPDPGMLMLSAEARASYRES